MEAHHLRAAVLMASLLSLGASHRTENFLVTSRSPDLSRQVAESAERYRRDLAIEWLGTELPPWSEKCPITVHAGPHLGAGGQTSFMFDRGRPFGWTMTIQGSPRRILDSVLPHEVTHTIFATYFGRPLPRWADEGACTTVEHQSERQKQERLLVQFLTTNRGIAFNHMFAMKEYPPDVLPLYAQGFSLARFLIAQGGKRQFVQYVGDGMKWNNWTRATQQYYGYESLSELQLTWLDWVRGGYRDLDPRTESVAAVSASAKDGGHAQTSSTSVAVQGSTPEKSGLTKLAAASGRQRGSWYARTRDQAYAARVAENPTDGKSKAANNSGQLVARPQPPHRPQQRVIQWRRSDRRIPAGQLSSPPRTVWR